VYGGCKQLRALWDAAWAAGARSERDAALADVERLTAECNLLLSEVMRLRAIVLETRNMTPDTPP
jgi:hypothetical protein